jgi:hypothetical protein
VVGPDNSIPADGAAGTAPGWLGDEGRSLRTLAVIWATVDLERARADLESAAVVRAAESPARAGLAASAFEDPHLGARVVVLPAAGNGVPVALAEPSTEGRLAATLARHGEGPAGRYVLVRAGLAAVLTRAAAAGIPLSAPAIGPFGRSVLVMGGRVAGPHLIPAGPHLILVDPPGTLAARAAVPSRP